MTLSEGKNLKSNFNFRGYIPTFQANSTQESWSFKTKNNAQTTSEQFQINFQKVKKNDFVTAKIVKPRITSLGKVPIFIFNLDLKTPILP